MATRHGTPRGNTNCVMTSKTPLDLAKEHKNTEWVAVAKRSVVSFSIFLSFFLSFFCSFFMFAELQPLTNLTHYHHHHHHYHYKLSK